MCETDLICQKQMKTYGKSNDEEHEREEELGKCAEDFHNHDNVDAKAREPPQEEDQVEPGDKDGEGSHLPLPVL